MSVRFQADADFKVQIVAAVQRQEPAVDFQGAVEAGLPALHDLDVLAQAAADDRVLVSHDRRTLPMHFAEFIGRASCPGVIIIPQHMPVAEAAEELLLIWMVTQPEEWLNRIYIV